MNSTSWLLKSVFAPRPFRLYCFSYAGGSGAEFLTWQSMLPAWVEIRAIQLPGRGARLTEPALTDLNEVADITSALIEREISGPFALFGHSLGALIAYEVTRRLVRRKRSTPKMLFVSGCHVPTRPSSKRALHTVGYDEFVARLHEYGGTPPEILNNTELMELLLPMIRADFEMAATYHHQVDHLIDVPLSVLAGTQEDREDPAQVEDWGRLSSEPTRVHWFEGGHFFIQSHLREVIDSIVADVSDHKPAM